MTTTQRESVEDYDLDVLQTIPNLHPVVADDVVMEPAVSRPPMSTREALEKLIADLNKADK